MDRLQAEHSFISHHDNSAI